jgi:predicted  nucleic acid-binding Zn-ribbon protein
MNIPNLSEAVANALERLRVVKEMPPSLARDEELLALNGELRKLRKRLWDQMNALPWGKERKTLHSLHEKVDRALSNWDYQREVDVRAERRNELEKKLSAGGLNDSTRRKLRKERRTIKALLSAMEKGRAESAAKSTAPATKTAAGKIAEYEALKARLLGSGKDEC